MKHIKDILSGVVEDIIEKNKKDNPYKADSLEFTEAVKTVNEYKRPIEIKDASIYCTFCGTFLGMTCDPFATHECSCKKGIEYKMAEYKEPVQPTRRTK
ncbi:MAG: hypothetical protein GY820_39100 [Gammaproteobacteria bacterium]|nr:hypothetical protein [Gammaproteobacteria bacterium]